MLCSWVMIIDRLTATHLLSIKYSCASLFCIFYPFLLITSCPTQSVEHVRVDGYPSFIHWDWVRNDYAETVINNIFNSSRLPELLFSMGRTTYNVTQKLSYGLFDRNGLFYFKKHTSSDDTCETLRKSVVSYVVTKKKTIPRPPTTLSIPPRPPTNFARLCLVIVLV